MQSLIITTIKKESRKSLKKFAKPQFSLLFIIVKKSCKNKNPNKPYFTHCVCVCVIERGREGAYLVMLIPCLPKCIPCNEISLSTPFTVNRWSTCFKSFRNKISCIFNDILLYASSGWQKSLIVHEFDVLKTHDF